MYRNVTKKLLLAHMNTALWVVTAACLCVREPLFIDTPPKPLYSTHISSLFGGEKKHRSERSQQESNVLKAH